MFLEFRPEDNIVLSLLIAILMIAIYFRARTLYIETKKPKMAIIEAGFLFGGICQLLHIYYSFLHDYIYSVNLYQVYEFTYLLFSNLFISFSIFLSIIVNSNLFKIKQEYLKKTIYIVGGLILFTLIIATLYLKSFNFSFADYYLTKIIINNPALRILDTSLYVLSALIYIDIKKFKKIKVFDLFLIGILIMGISQFYIITPEYISSYYRFYIHFAKIAGLAFLYFGIKSLTINEPTFSFSLKLSILPSLLLLIINFIIMSLISLFFNVNYPMYISYVVFLLFLLAIFTIYIVSSSFMNPLKNLIKEIEDYRPYTRPNIIQDKPDDEIGLLIDKINESNLLVWTYTKELTLKQEQIEDLNKQRDAFIATLVHDLRSPIFAEQKALEAILSKKLGISFENYSEYLEDIYQTNDNLLRIINNLLRVYHYESGQFELNFELVNIKQVIKNSMKILKHMAKDKESEIICFECPDNLPEIAVDVNEITRVITNLLSNAIKHNKKGTQIQISFKLQNNEIQVSFKDNGKGISESEQSKIFQRYPTEKRKIGTGLGLYLSKQIIDAHNGKIWFTTEEQKGTTFYFSLPIVQTDYKLE